MKVWLNQQLVPLEQAAVSVLDHGFLYGHGVFETMRTYHGQVFLLHEHMERLRRAAADLRIPFLPSVEEIQDAITVLLKDNRLQDAYVRVTVTRGKGPMGVRGTFGEPTILIFAKELILPALEVYQQGRDLCVLRTVRNSPETGDRVKSLNYLNSLAGIWELDDRGYAEGIMLNDKGAVAEGTVSNLFFAIDGMLATPSLETGILPGVTRAYVIKLSKKLGIPVHEKAFGVGELADFAEGFVTNSLVGIIPIRSIESIRYPLVPGPVTQMLMDAYKGALEGGI
jgi:branched-chain amino acid aminotransferase/4-amino-4-deoxychorismate lyase